MKKIIALALFTISCGTPIALEDKEYFSLEEALKTPDRVNKLDLEHDNLTSLPESIGNLTNLTTISLYKDQLNESEIEKLNKLLPNCEIFFNELIRDLE